MIKILSDPNWLGTIVAIIALILMIFIEWPKVKDRLTEHPRFSRILRGVIFGAIITAICGAIGGLVSTWTFITLVKSLSQADIDLLNIEITNELYKQVIVITGSDWATNWLIFGALISGLFSYKGDVRTKNIRQGILGASLGMLIGFFVAGIIDLVFYLDEITSILDLCTELINMICFQIGASVGGGLLGIFAGGIIYQLAQGISAE